MKTHDKGGGAGRERGGVVRAVGVYDRPAAARPRRRLAVVVALALVAVAALVAALAS
jgi:hypothetical protein